MKLPISWLREWVAVDAAPEAIAEALTRRGLYVEGIETHGHRYPGVVAGRVLEVQRHPNADRLSLCRVDGGAGELRVVCGAPNVRSGMWAPLATVGSKLPGGLEIRRSKIRGEESQGMLCSARELELSDDAEGIVDLERLVENGALQAGRPLDELLGPPDTVLDVEAPFNRPDALGIVGLAREVKAAFGGSWTPEAKSRLEGAWSAGTGFPVHLEDVEGCPLYLAQVVEEVKVEPSPRWLARRLEAAGQRPINHVVDLTNWVLLEFGQPLHAFDLDTLRGPEIRVRRARSGERIVTLDGRERTLDAEVLAIADRERAVAVAGVMGGAETEVSESTRRLLLECAWFEPRRVRRAARSMGLVTEASRRFERRVNPLAAPAALQRFLGLIGEVCPGARRGSAGRADEMRDAPKTVELRLSRLRRVSGIDLGLEDARRCLESLEFRTRPREDRLEVELRPDRPDVALEDDLVEEVARSWGYDRIPEAWPETGGTYATRSARERVIERARRAMIGGGLTEAWTTTLVSVQEGIDAAALTGAGADTLVRLVNPTSREGEFLRPSPLPGLLRAVAHNLSQGMRSVRLFEVGTGFRTRAGSLPEESLMLCGVLSGSRYAHAHDAMQGELEWDDAHGTWEAWLTEMSVDTPRWRAYSSPGWKPGASAEVASGTSRIGWAGALGQQMLRAWGIEVPVHAFVVHLDLLVRDEEKKPLARVPGRFPPVRRDLAFFLPEAVTHDQLESVLCRAAGEWLVALELFDVYTGPGTPQGMKSLAFEVQFQHPERTLTEAEIQTIQERMTAAVAAECGGRLRDR